MEFRFTHLQGEGENPRMQDELGHSPMLSVALCPMEARSVIAEVAFRAISAMLAKGDNGFPTDIAVEGNAKYAACQEEWTATLYMMQHAFELLSTQGDWEYDDDAISLKEEMVDGLLLFAQRAVNLWI